MNKILSLEDDVGNWLHDEVDIRNAIHNYFFNNYTTSCISSVFLNWDLYQPPQILSPSQQTNLSAPLRDSEIKHAIFSLQALKATGPDGFHLMFYQR